MVKNTYLAREKAGSPNSRLVEITASEWYRIIEENKKLPKEKRRYFIVSTIEDGDMIDRMHMETSHEEYKRWNIEKTMCDDNLRCEENFKQYSLDAVPESSNHSSLMDALSVDGTMEEQLLEKDMIERLKAAVKTWEPWAYELFLCYLAGEKRSCTKKLAKKYGISEQAMRARKRRFEELCKNFFES